ncbi:unnamed protein product [Diatraea saccharalis]|uniref:Uncharacterized protein n=1 Tax=Diatraea saccharalis TaxID=40085 RepID=A0A9N9RB57_9NEOP|nr:unnamed protein product [Diatraea saccharalis]
MDGTNDKCVSIFSCSDGMSSFEIECETECSEARRLNDALDRVERDSPVSGAVVAAIRDMIRATDRQHSFLANERRTHGESVRHIDRLIRALSDDLRAGASESSPRFSSSSSSSSPLEVSLERRRRRRSRPRRTAHGTFSLVKLALDAMNGALLDGVIATAHAASGRSDGHHQHRHYRYRHCRRQHQHQRHQRCDSGIVVDGVDAALDLDSDLACTMRTACADGAGAVDSGAASASASALASISASASAPSAASSTVVAAADVPPVAIATDSIADRKEEDDHHHHHQYHKIEEDAFDMNEYLFPRAEAADLSPSSFAAAGAATAIATETLETPCVIDSDLATIFGLPAYGIATYYLTEQAAAAAAVAVTATAVVASSSSSSAHVSVSDSFRSAAVVLASASASASVPAFASFAVATTTTVTATATPLATSATRRGGAVVASIGLDAPAPAPTPREGRRARGGGRGREEQESQQQQRQHQQRQQRVDIPSIYPSITEECRLFVEDVEHKNYTLLKNRPGMKVRQCVLCGGALTHPVSRHFRRVHPNYIFDNRHPHFPKPYYFYTAAVVMRCPEELRPPASVAETVQGFEPGFAGP